MLEKLNLIWRIVGGNLLILALGYMLVNGNHQSASYLVTTNLLVVGFTTFHLIRRKLTINSKIWDVITVYLLCRFSVDICFTRTGYDCMAAICSSIIAAMWIYKFYYKIKIKQNSANE